MPIKLSHWQIKNSAHNNSPIKMVKNIQLKENDHAIKILASYGFDMMGIRKNDIAVPRIYFAKLPPELTKIKDTKIRKRLFLSSLLPPILKVNEIIRQDRKKLKNIILKITIGENVSEMDYYWLTQKMIQYKVHVVDVNDFLNRTGEILQELLSKINIIPPELALAQAVQESGWGTSRFAQQGNALYGQWSWGKGCGITPSERDENQKHQIRCFKNIIEAVESYMLNLNTHKAYKELRNARQNFRDDTDIKAIPLIETLTNYSEEGPEYVEKIKRIIRTNRLRDFKNAKLEDKK